MTTERNFNTIQPKHGVAFALVGVLIALFAIVAVGGDTLPTCTDGQPLEWSGASGAWGCGTDATGGGAGILDLGDDDVNESTAIAEIATTGDTNSVFTEPAADKLLIDLGQNWPSADTADALSANGANCAAGNYPLGVDAAGAVESCTADDDLPDADEIVESMLKAVDAAVDEECLTYEATVGDFEWQTCGAGGSGDSIEIEDGDDAGTFTAIDTTARFDDSGDIDFTFADGGAGGPDTVTATVRANSVALGTDTTGNYAGSGSEGGAATTALALDADPTDCAADTKADAIAANGNLTCSAVDTGDITDGTILEADLAAVDAPVDEECLTYEATVGDFEWQVCGGAGANSFETHDVPSGTDPVADSSSDTLTWTSTGGTITLTGDSATDTINVEAVDVTCTDCLTATEITDIYVLIAGDAITGDLDFNDGVTDSPKATFTPATGTAWDIFTEDTGDDLQIEVTTGATETLDIVNTGAGVVDVTVDGTITGGTVTGTTAVTGPNVTSGANPGHTHTTTSISGLDVSDDLNLTAGRSLTLTGDDVAADAELYTETKGIWFEDPTAADDFASIWVNNTGNGVTITAIWCETDQTVNFDLQVDDGTPAAVNGSDIACTSTPVDDTSFAGDTTVGDNERIDLAITSVSGTPTWVSIMFTFTKDD